MAATKPVLFSFFRSSCAWRIRLVLAFKNIDYEYRAVDLLKKPTEPYLGVNPLGQVPSLLIDGKTLTQSVSIFEYLEEKYPEKPLLPKDILERAKVREVAEVISSGIQPVQNLSVLRRLPRGQRDQWAHDTIDKGFTALETLLGECSGRYSVGDQFSWADCCIVPQIANGIRLGVDMSKFPIMSRVNDNISQLSIYEAAHPSQQPDCPGHGTSKL